MSKFMEFKTAIQNQFAEMEIKGGELFTVKVSKDKLWETYLNSFPKGTNEIFRERPEHDCQCCKQFIRACGNVVAINGTKLVSIWGVEAPTHYQVVADAMDKLVKSKEIENVFRHYQNTLGTNFNHDNSSENVIKWEHFYYKLDSKFVKQKDKIGTVLSKFKSNKDVFKRGLEELTKEAVETVLELIAQDSIYRGEENLTAVNGFSKLSKKYYKLKNKKTKDKFAWMNMSKPGARIRNTAIGTLLVDISNEIGLTKAVLKYEAKVAPENYKRSSAPITKGMIKKAQEKVEELGITDSLSRRYAISEDITINNVLFANRKTKKIMDNVFDELANETPDLPKGNLKKIEDVDIKTFVNEILPRVSTVELKVENSHMNNFMSLMSPIDKTSRGIFKWDNNFSWSYNGDVTDSIKEKVKRAGGNVEGILRWSLSWYNYDDLDIHAIEPGGHHIYYEHKHRKTSGVLDVDMNAGERKSRDPVENIVWTNKRDMLEGRYRIFVNQFQLRENKNVGFEIEMEFNNEIHTFHYDKQVRGNVEVAEFEFSKTKGIKFLKSLKSTTAQRELWGIKTQQFQNVKMIMNSPNHWDGEQTGNKHYFFILENCVNPDPGRGFYNEFLNEQLQEHRKVFEVLGGKMLTEPSNNQLSGLGFSSTNRNKLTCKLTGNFTRLVNINF